MHASYSSSVFATTVGYDIAYGRTASISITKFSSHQNQFPPAGQDKDLKSLVVFTAWNSWWFTNSTLSSFFG